MGWTLIDEVDHSSFQTVQRFRRNKGTNKQTSTLSTLEESSRSIPSADNFSEEHHLYQTVADANANTNANANNVAETQFKEVQSALGAAGEPAVPENSAPQLPTTTTPSPEAEMLRSNSALVFDRSQPQMIRLASVKRENPIFNPRASQKNRPGPLILEEPSQTDADGIASDSQSAPLSPPPRGLASPGFADEGPVVQTPSYLPPYSCADHSSGLYEAIEHGHEHEHGFGVQQIEPDHPRAGQDGDSGRVRRGSGPGKIIL